MDRILSSNLPEGMFDFILIWGVMNFIYWMFIIFGGESDSYSDYWRRSLISNMIAYTFNDMTKVGLFIMKPLVFLIKFLEFGGAIALVIIILVDVWFVVLGATVFGLFVFGMNKLIYKPTN